MSTKSVILGFGISGRSAAAFLLKQGHRVLALDQKGASLGNSLQGVDLYLDDPCHLDGASELILSPGIPFTHPVVLEAKRRGIPVVGEAELAFRHLQNRCIGVTGSNGKTTTTLLMTHVLNFANIPAKALGNVGVGLTSYLLNPDLHETLIIELSSFQIEALQTPRLQSAIVLNIFENHLDRYASMQEYAGAKMRIQNILLPGGTLFFPPSVFQTYGALAPNATVVSEESNLSLAFAVLQTLGISEEIFSQALSTFTPPPHRREEVATIDGVIYYNDSKASNVVSVLYAVSHMARPVVLIVGGTDKGSCYTPWIHGFKGRVKHIFAYGLAADKIEKELNCAFPLTKVGPFAEAVDGARSLATRGDAVLLSPGCASYDQFRNFEHRGEVFKQMVTSWIPKKQS